MWLQNHICGGAMGCYRKWRDRKRPWPEMTSVTWPEEALTGTESDRVRMCNRYNLSYYYSSSTKCSTVLQAPWLPKCFPWVCACPSGSCAISALVGPFDRKWRYETSPVMTEGGGRCVCMRNRKLCNIRPSGGFSSDVPLWEFSRTSASCK
jgi:hypothetical protein